MTQASPDKFCLINKCFALTQNLKYSMFREVSLFLMEQTFAFGNGFLTGGFQIMMRLLQIKTDSPDSGADLPEGG